MKKIWSVILTGAMALSAFTGCGSGASGNSNFQKETADKLGDLGGLELPLADKPTVIEWSVTTDHENFNSSWVAAKLREVTGIDVQFRVVPAATAKDKLSVWIASKNLPNIIGQGIEKAVSDDLAMQGGIAAVEDYMDILPNFKKTFIENEKNNWIFKSYVAPDGKLYGFYGYDWNRDVNHGVLYRKDIFEKHNIPMWNGPDEFYNALKKLKQQYPSSTPFTSKNKDNLFGKLATSWGIKAFEPYYDETDSVWKYSDIDPKFKDMLNYVKKLYDEKLLDPEFLTLTQAAWTSKMTQADKAFVTWDWIGRLNTLVQQASGVPGYDMRYGNPIGPSQTVAEAEQLCWARYVAKNKNAETSFKLLDFLLSPAGAELITMGLKEETYELDDKGMAKYTEYTYADAENTPDMSKLIQKYGMFTEGIYLKFDRRSIYFNFTEREQEAQNYAKDPSHLDPIDPVIVFTAEEQEKVNEYRTKLDKAGREFVSKYILSNETGDAAWNAWLEKANGLGVQELINIYNEAQKKYDGKN